jgi:hypothetical protein
MQMALESLSWAGLTSVDSILFAEAASVLPDHAHFFSTKASVFDRHAEERVFVGAKLNHTRVSRAFWQWQPAPLLSGPNQIKFEPDSGI